MEIKVKRIVSTGTESYKHTANDIAIMSRALLNGKTIQFYGQMYRGENYKWHDCVLDEEEFFFHHLDTYRIKPD